MRVHNHTLRTGKERSTEFENKGMATLLEGTDAPAWVIGERAAAAKKAGKAAFGTKEWASTNVNILIGCQHDCVYCFAKGGAVNRRHRDPETWKTPTVKWPMVTKGWKKHAGTMMFSSTHDLHPDNLEECVTVLRKMLQAGNKVLIVSKPHRVCIERVCLEFEAFKSQILFRFSIGSADDAVLRVWEPNAPSFAERVACLKYAHQQGFETSVSCEPMLDADIHAVIRAVKPYVTDAIWIGRANKLQMHVSANRPGDGAMHRRAEELVALMSDDYIKALFARYEGRPKIKWKDSIKKVVGLARPTVKGLDV